MENQCVLCSTCNLYIGEIELPEDMKVMYTFHYCLNPTGKWKECRRFAFETLNGSCPDFVMPNSLLTIDQIWQRTQREYTLSS